MRNILMAGTAAFVLALGASSAYAVPPNSPYAIWEPQAVDQGTMPSGFAGGDPGPVYGVGALLSSTVALPGELIEGRSAFVEDHPAAAYDPYRWQVTPAEDNNYYSRGR